MKTLQTKVEFKFSVWAIPLAFADEGELPFEFKVMMGLNTPWQDGSVKIMERDSMVVVPAGIDLLSKAIETLKGEIQKTRAEAQVQVEKYEKQLDGLLQLTFQEHPVKDDMTGLVE